MFKKGIGTGIWGNLLEAWEHQKTRVANFCFVGCFVERLAVEKEQDTDEVANYDSQGDKSNNSVDFPDRNLTGNSLRPSVTWHKQSKHFFKAFHVEKPYDSWQSDKSDKFDRNQGLCGQQIVRESSNDVNEEPARLSVFGKNPFVLGHKGAINVAVLAH